MSQLFRRKYVIASATIGTKRGKIERGTIARGSTPDNRKKTCEASQTEMVGAERLNRTLTARCDLLCAQSDMIKLSRATTMVAAEGPNIRTAANTKVSETERRAGIEGTLIVNDPLKRVSPAQTNHSTPTGWCQRVMSERSSTVRPVQITTPK
jgi:hypothetical protein